MVGYFLSLTAHRTAPMGDGSGWLELPTIGEPREGLAFQQDNAADHRALSTRCLIAALGLEVLEWPAPSPDLNPIENLWHWLKNFPRQISQTDTAKDATTGRQPFNKAQHEQHCLTTGPRCNPRLSVPRSSWSQPPAHPRHLPLQLQPQRQAGPSCSRQSQGTRRTIHTGSCSDKTDCWTRPAHFRCIRCQRQDRLGSSPGRNSSD